MRKYTFRKIAKILRKDGWYVSTVKGSHYHFQHPSKSGKVTVPNHSGNLSDNTVKSIERQSGIHLS